MLTFRDHFLSVFQSAAADYASKAPVDEARSSMTTGGADFIRAAGEVAELRSKGLSETAEVEEGLADIPRICASLGLRYLEAAAMGDPGRASRIKEQLTGGACDPAWASTLVEYAKYFGVSGTRGTIPYRRPSEIGSRTIPIRPGCRIAIFGDWGTGAGPARRILQAISVQKPDLLLHLGDIYYSGTAEECSVNFAGVIRDVFSERPIPTYTLAGNHDMYSGGGGYYDLIANLNDGPAAQKTSFFCLRTTDSAWQVLAMDTGLHDYSPLSVTDALTFVEDEEQSWLSERVREFSGRTILVSHHQLFSAFSQIGKPTAEGKLLFHNPSLLELLRKLQGVGDIAAWFWGHEHNLCIYEPHSGLERGRCVGHAAIPIFEEETPYRILDGLTDPPVLRPGTQLPVRDGAFAHGYVILALGAGNEQAHAQYFTDDGLLYAETF